ncbi:unnamed protein product [Sphagnum jensenii]|uniref:Uncharacterized protein n=1 Tax=Sphagnum jensenii TaxID=128206 RepID=A0ABP1A7N6_9BRYO
MLQCCCRSAIPVTASLGTTRKSHRAVMCAALLSRDDSCKLLATDSSPSLEHQIQNASPLLTCLHFSTTVPAAAAVPPSLELSPKKCRRFYAGGIEERWIKAGRRKSSLSGQVEPPCKLLYGSLPPTYRLPLDTIHPGPPTSSGPRPTTAHPRH